ncbi:Co-chaperone Hsc20 [Trametes versicolor FP-101664 SS1]|uniref:Co-chaperone Hsc20 n=1 Tax=Trametes versicolor (strain FP-101664) TaxID=717944 RepID=UPI0004622B00|nr:Co-chaperone Hsc20 [Trametes versicolor FP-101664 SS1]EIW64664.1 Co-chaperone Hsc20 [Trametes versicolor FP-101664 SS1]
MLRVCALASLALRARPAPLRHAVRRGPPQLRHASPATTINVRRNHTDATGHTKLCPSCSAPLPTALPVCSKCQYIEPIPQSMTYHEMLGTPYEPNPFVVDVSQLKQQLRAVQAVVHPDRWVSRPSDQQAIAAAMSSRVNEALHRLSSPLRRAEYILACEGHAGEETDKLDDMELLMEVMEAREGLANAQSPEDVAEIREQNDAKIQEVLQEIESVVAAKDWPALRTAAVKLKYLQGIESAAAAWPEVAHDH